ncbi:patatin-like phospholipase family protein [Merdibacter massiliensis]|uniref:patatin-like phospholipase family protein n=1 Tax=Merdibacter massiliensis TaxID=1871030 RepID=UPI00096A9EBD|nr:patatin family protein [Merdibacter massiliensis]
MAEKTTALILEGGALRGVYTSGVLDVMMLHHLKIDHVVGISAGSLNGLYYVSNQIGKAAELNLNYVRDSRYMGMSHLAKEKSFFNFDFVFQDIFNELIPFDFDAFQRSDIQFWAGVTNCATGKIEFIEKRQQDDFLNVCRASSSIPILCSPVEIDGQYYVDGGVACAIPLFEDLPFHADRLVLVLTRHKGYRKSSVPEPLQKFYRHHFKNAPGMIDRLVTAPLRYNEKLDEIEQLEKEGKVFVIQPKKPVSVSRIEKDVEKLTALYQDGREDMEFAYRSLHSFLAQ